MAINPSNTAVLTFEDYDGEQSRFEINSAVLTAANLVAQDALLDTLQVATVLVTLGAIVRKQIGAQTEQFDPAPVTDPIAQRESKWLVRYADTVTFVRYGVTIPTADLTKLEAGGSKKMDISAGDGLSFVTAFEAYAKSPDGNPVQVLEVVNVGRNL